MRTRRGGRLAFSTDTRMAPRISAVWASSRWPKPWPRASHLARRAGSRSEEGRGGKEGRSRWGPDPLKKKNEQRRENVHALLKRRRRTTSDVARSERTAMAHQLRRTREHRTDHKQQHSDARDYAHMCTRV